MPGATLQPVRRRLQPHRLHLLPDEQSTAEDKGDEALATRETWMDKGYYGNPPRGGIAKNPYQSKPCGTVLGATGAPLQSQRLGGYIAHPDPTWWLGGFSDSSSSVGLTEEQEYQIAENIFDWWISGKSYKKWYAEKFLQLKLEFKE